MKLIALKFGLALGIALSISFLICNIIFSIGGKHLTLNIKAYGSLKYMFSRCNLLY